VAHANYHLPVADATVISPPSPLEAEVKLGQQRIMRVRVVGGMVVLTSGRIEERSVRKAFLECATITIPFRILPEVRAALTRAARLAAKNGQLFESQVGVW
jgi:hypothetical protein